MWFAVQKKYSPLCIRPFRHFCFASCHASSQRDPVFAKPREGPFVQQSPYLENSFNGDAFLQRNLERILPQEVSKKKLSMQNVK